MARLALTIVGTAIGGPIGGAIGGLIGGYIDQSMAPGVTVEGPRLSDLASGSASEGADIPIVWGTARIGTNVIFSEPIRETRKQSRSGGKGSGGPKTTTTTYTYSCSFAVSCGMQIGRPRRIWANRKLIYDARPEAEGVAFSGLQLTIYDGTQTAPDADIESAVGVGNVPAYTGQPVIVFHDLQLAEFGNRVPSIEVELVELGSDASSINAVSLSDTLNRQSTAYMPYDRQRGLFYVVVDTYMKAIDRFGNVVKEKKIDVAASDPECVAIFPNGNIFLQEGSAAYVLNSDDWSILRSVSSNLFQIPVTAIGDGIYYNAIACCYAPFSVNQIITFDGINVVNHGFVPDGYVFFGSSQSTGLASFDYSLMVPLRNESTNNLHFFIFEVPGFTWYSAPSFDPLYTIDESSISQGGITPTYNDETRTVWWLVSEPGTSPDFHVLEIARSGTVINDYNIGRISIHNSKRLSYFVNLDNQTIYWQDHNYTVKALSMQSGAIRTIASLPESISLFFCDEQQSVALGISAPFFSDDKLFVARLVAVDVEEKNIAAIIEDVCERVGIAAQDIDTTGIDDTVQGYVLTRRDQASALLKQLTDMYFIDIVESDWKVRFVKRGADPIATIYESDLVLSDASFKITHPARIEFPRSIDFRYASTENDGQPSVASAYSYVTDSHRRVTYSTAATLDNASAAKIADRLLQTGHELKRYEFALSEQYAYLEPTDVVLLNVYDETYRVRLTSVARGANGVIEVVAVDDAAYNLTSFATGRGAMEPAAKLPQPIETQALHIDTGLLRDEDADHPGAYITAFSYSPGFLSTVIISSADGGEYSEVGLVPVEPIVGTVETPASAQSFEAWDDTNTLRVELVTPGTLASATDDALLYDRANVGVYGRPGRWEVVQWGAASLVSAGVYDISHLLRGRRGTDWAIDQHQPGDLFVVLDADVIVREVLTVADIGLLRYYKTPNTSQAEADVIPATREVGNAPLVPYSPSNPLATLDGSDVGLTWTRRTRRGGSYGGPNGVTDGVGGILAEDTESYEVDIFDAGDLSTVVRAVTGLTAPTYTYTAANIAADGFSLLDDDITFRIYQISAVVGRGYVAQTTFSMPGISHTIANHDAETGDTSGWTVETGAFAVRSSNPAPAQGQYYFFAGAGPYARMASSVIDVIADGVIAAKVDAGQMSVRVDALQNSFAGSDQGRVGVRFLDASDALISESWGASRAPTNWMDIIEVFAYPVGTRSIQVLLDGTRAAGTNNDAYFDMISARSVENV